MNMIRRKINNDSELVLGGLLTFFISFFVYLRTVAPTVSLWDCGEFIASSYILGVPHPPGAPFYLIIGKIFSLIPFHADIGFRVNMISVLSSSFTILFLYLIITQLIRSYQGTIEEQFDKFIVCGAALIGALTLAFSYTFWFNAVEAEVYAPSMLFTSATLWLALRWFEHREELSSIRNLIVIVYLVGLSYGVHLLNILVVPTIILLILFHKPRFLFVWRLWYLAMLVASTITILVFMLLGGKMDHLISLFVLNCVLFLLAGSFIYTYKSFIQFSLENVLIAASCAVGGILIALTVCIDKLSVLNATLGTWELPILVGFDNPLFVYLVFMVISFTAGFVILEYKPELLTNWKSLLLSMSLATAAVWFIVAVGRSTYALILIRSGLDPVINENDPSTMSNLLYYLNREQYGTTSLLSTALDRAAPLWEYQIKFMFLRYFGWNFIGKGITFDTRGFIQESFALRGLLGFPFLIGLFGFVYHSIKDWKKAISMFVFFIASGLLLVLYLNQPDPQPRERDYVYVGSFFVFAVWIGLGAYGIMNSMKMFFANDSVRKFGAAFAGGILLFFCPINEFQFNFDEGDRTGNFVPWDYSYNILTSCEENAILFTNGDNDTFPLWYLQEVEGIRKDVRIVNLSLLNTPWYIEQLKYYEPRLAINLQDEQIKAIRPIAWESKTLQVQVTQQVFESFYQEYNQPVPESLVNTTSLSVQVDPTLTVGSQTGVQVRDIMVFHIIDANKWDRPVYFAITVSPSYFLGFKPYLRLEGLVYRVTPVQSPPVLTETLGNNLMKKYQYRGINDPDVNLDFGTVRLLGNYRQGFLDLSRNYINTRQPEKAVEALDFMTEHVPEFRSTNRNIIEIIGRHYYAAGQQEAFRSRILELLIGTPEISRDKQFEYAGLLFSAFKDTLNTEKTYERLWESDPNDNKALGALVSIYEFSGQISKAVSALEQWLGDHPADSVAQNKLKGLRPSPEN